MSEDATLDAFADGSATSDTDSATSGDVDSESTTAPGDESATTDTASVVTDAATDTTDAESDTSDAETGTVDAIAVTSSWRANATCSACGEPVGRRWRDGDDRVCVECATWTTTGRGACDQ